MDEQRASKNAHYFKDRSVQFEFVLDDSNKTICNYCDMYLYFYAILRFSPDSLYAKMLLDPFEEQFHLPSVSVKQSDVLCIKVEIVGVVHKRPVEFLRIVNDSSKSCWIVVEVPLGIKPYGLVIENTVCSV